jgi:hypothetical protein
MKSARRPAPKSFGPVIIGPDDWHAKTASAIAARLARVMDRMRMRVHDATR